MTDVLYLEGDQCSPKYVAGALRAAGHDVEVVTSAHPSKVRPASCILLSDVPAGALGVDALTELAQLVEAGAGLLAVGGWASFGRGGYATTPLARILPVELKDGDDRHNLPSGAHLVATDDDLLRGLPFDEPPVICGYNDVRRRVDARVLVEAQPFNKDPRRIPVLVLGEHGRGRIAVLSTDLAPHWSGGLTDWGGRPILVGEGEELGWAYVELLSRLVTWAARAEPSRHRAEEARR